MAYRPPFSIKNQSNKPPVKVKVHGTLTAEMVEIGCLLSGFRVRDSWETVGNFGNLTVWVVGLWLFDGEAGLNVTSLAEKPGKD